MDRKQEKWLKIINIILVVMVIAVVINTIKLFANAQIAWAGDLVWIWREYALTLRGYDCVDIISEQIDVLGIGVNPISATVPWARIIGNVLIPGYLSKQGAIVYGFCMYIICAYYAIHTIIKHIEKTLVNCNEYRALIVLFFAASFYWSDAIFNMNNGVVICFLLMIMISFMDRNEGIAGILLALAFIKPQIAGPFYITLLLHKKYKTIVTSIVVTCVSWGIYILYIGGNPIEQCLEILGGSESKSADFIWFGICDWLTNFGASGTLAMICSMIVGIIITVICSKAVLNSENYRDNVIVLYSVPAMVSTIWCYKSTSDLIILFLDTILLVYVLNNVGINVKSVVASLTVVVIFNMKLFCGIIRRMIGYDWILGVNLDAMARIIVYIMLLTFLLNYQEKNINYC